ncbi:MAG: amidohydrolase family protein [Candidatus Aminicenantes bacterium]|jgi:enamidase
MKHTIRRHTIFILSILCILTLHVDFFAEIPKFSRETKRYILYQSPIIALKNVDIIRGDGSPAQPDQTVLIKDGRIAQIGDASSIGIPEGAEVLDLTGKSLLPGFIMFHEHMFYPSGRGFYNQLSYTFPRLYLAGGVTTMRTAGSMQPYSDLNIRKAIETGQIPGPTVHVTSPYFNNPGLPLFAVKGLKGPDDAREMVAYWEREGVDDFKAYMHISQENLKVLIEEAHKRGKKVTGHLGAVTYREAADLGIDNLEHGFFYSTDFVTNKVKDKNPSSMAQRKSLIDLDPNGPEAQALIEHLVEKGVAITSTLVVMETFIPGRPRISDAALEALLPETRDQYLRTWSRIATSKDTSMSKIFKNNMEMEKLFFKAGGLLIVGTDPTGYGGVIAGYANSGAIELLVEAGLTPLEAIQVATLNGAKYLEIEDELGTIEAGKIADLVVVKGNPASRIKALRNVEIVFKDGIGYDSAKLFESAKGLVGLR